MAEQVPCGVATSLINTLASLAFEEIASIYRVKKEIEWLKETVEAIKAVLVEADQKQQTDQLIQLWIRGLKQVLYEADDLLDELHTQHLLRKRDGKGKAKEKVRDFFQRYEIAGKISKIKEKFNAIAERMSKLDLNQNDVVMKHEKSNWRKTSSLVYQEDIVGREEDKKHVIDLLLTNNSNQNVSSVAIVGVGGLGKTALAQLVFNDAEVKSFFTKQMWVCVSDEFDVKLLVKKILGTLVGQSEGDQELELLQKKLHQNLNGQRFLLVLDDTWNEDAEKWWALEKFLRCGAEGSKILLTTRSQTVAEKMGVKKPYILKELENDQSWALLQKLAFEDRIMTPNLESIGNEIAKKCAGVPLAVRVMGRLLQSKSTESDWEAILEGDFWKSSKEDNSIMSILKLSFDNLTIELKQCFAYCSLYPKDWRYEKDELIDLWMAQGFLENEDDKQFPEDVGEEYIYILLTKSFFQDVEEDEFGEIKYFKMHDLMHDMSWKIAGSDYCLDVDERRKMCPIHATFGKYDFGSLINMVDPSRLRTILKLREEYETNPCNLSLFKGVRSLDFSRYDIRDLPKSIAKMSHLRYLNLSDCEELTRLPKGISNLINLQTLILKQCRRLKFSGEIITRLINLRRLDIEACEAFEDGMPIGLGRMTALQNLSSFRVGNDDKQRKKAKLNELKELNLRDKLVISNLGFVRKVEEESKDVNLRSKKNLISLTLHWGYVDAEMKSTDALQLLENLCPHPNLKGLTIKEYPGVCLPNWLLTSTNLVQLDFSLCKNCQYLPALEGFVSLKTLFIGGMLALEYICYKGCSSSTNFFPSLEELKILCCESLRGWQREADAHNTRDNEKRHSLPPPFPRLSSLTISDCPNLSCMPTFPNLVRHLELCASSTKPLIDTLNVSSTGPSASHYPARSLSKLKFLNIEEIDIEALPEEWMRNLANLQHLSIVKLSNPGKLFREMRNLSAKLEEFTIQGIDNLDSWNSDEDYKIRWQDLCFLHSLRQINFEFCRTLKALPEWICDFPSLRMISIFRCPMLESFPAGMCRLTNLQTLQLVHAPALLKERRERETGAEWPKIAHIPNIQIDS